MKLNILFESVINEATDHSFVAYHGTDHDIKLFSDSFVDGEGNTQHHGPGIYFATSYKNARMFGKNVYKVEINGKFIDTDTSVRNVDVKEVITLMKMSGEDEDEWEMEAQNYDENPQVGIQKAAKYALQVAGDEASVFFNVLNGWYQHTPLRYIKSMTKLGYDGLVVDAPRDWVGEKHIIVFNPNAIKFIGKE
jgi:hypothetical protein